MDRLLNTLKVRLSGVTEAALQLELFNTIDEFFRKTNAWRYESDVTLAQGSTQYPIFPPAATALVQIMGVTHKGIPVAPMSTGGSALTQRGQITADILSGTEDATYFPDATVSEGGVFAYSLYYPQYITIDIPPSEEATEFPIKITLALTLAAINLEDDAGEWALEPWMYESFHEAWVDGTQGRMMSMANKPWTNPQMAVYHMKRFRNAMAQAKHQFGTGMIFNATSWRFPRGGFV
jgi:hypothetical protein